MENATGQPLGEICHRCLQPIAANARRCPKCGEPHSSTNRLAIFIGALGLLALVFVAVIMLRMARNSDIDSAPPAQTDQSAPQQSGSSAPFNP
jgi:hypothetical protein